MPRSSPSTGPPHQEPIRGSSPTTIRLVPYDTVLPTLRTIGLPWSSGNPGDTSTGCCAPAATPPRPIAGPPANIRIFRIFVPDSPEVIKHLVFRNRLHPNQDDRDL